MQSPLAGRASARPARFSQRSILLTPPPAGLRTLRAPSACATACDNGGRPRPFLAHAAPRGSRNCDAASFLERPPRVAFSFSRLAEPGRRCCRERGLARGATPQLNRQAGRGGDPYPVLLSIPD